MLAAELPAPGARGFWQLLDYQHLQKPRVEDEPTESEQLRKRADRLLENTSPVPLVGDLPTAFEESRVSLPAQVLGEIREQIERGEYVDVPVGSFFDLAVKSGQVTRAELERFVTAALALLSAGGDYFVDRQRESIQVRGGGEVFIFRTGNQTHEMRVTLWQDVLSAIGS